MQVPSGGIGELGPREGRGPGPLARRGRGPPGYGQGGLGNVPLRLVGNELASSHATNLDWALCKVCEIPLEHPHGSAETCTQNLRGGYWTQEI